MAPVIEVEGLTFSYPGAEIPAVRDVSFAVAQGEIFGFLGPSGAGKTTTQNVLIGLLQGYAGRASVLGRDVASWGREYYEHVGVAFELPNHYLKLTARENLEFFRALYPAGPAGTEPPERLLHEVGLEDSLDIRVGEFSKGMKHRLNVARSLLHRPQVWFLDEPTAGLDPGNSRRIRSLVRTRRDQGVTTFLTTHDMLVADELCDRVGFLVDGRLTVVESPAHLKRLHGRRAVRVEYATGAPDEFDLDGLGDNPAFLRGLRERRVETIHSQETTLEQVFIEVTGRELQ